MALADFETIENKVTTATGSYKGLCQQALLTCEADFESMFNALPACTTWIELGSGHGLGPILFGKKFPDRKAIGLEFDLARFEASLKHSTLPNVSFIHANLIDADIPEGDVYFIYLPTGIVLDRILHHLGNAERNLYLVAIESHGDLLPRLEKEKWLSLHSEVPLASERHYPNAIIYKKISSKKPDIHDASFQKKMVIVQDPDCLWIAESYGLEWLRGEEYQLLTPPRTISEFQIMDVVEFDQIPQEFHSALLLRRLGMLTLHLTSSVKSSFLRKIIISPSFKLELSSGEQVEWSQVKQIYWENTLCYDSLSDYFFYPHVV